MSSKSNTAKLRPRPQKQRKSSSERQRYADNNMRVILAPNNPA